MIKNKCKNNGFTLVELVITIIVLGIVSFGGAILLSKGFDAFFSGRNVVDADWQARIAMEKMSRELRNIRSPSDIISGSSTSGLSSISFVDNNGNTVNYYVSGSNIMRTSSVDATPRVLSDGAGLTLSYYDSTGTITTATTTNVRYIVITISTTYGGANFNLTTGVYPWNLH